MNTSSRSDIIHLMGENMKLNILNCFALLLNIQCSAKALGKWGQMTHTNEKYGDIGNFCGDTYVIHMLPFVNLKLVGTWAPAAKIIGDILDFNVLNVPKT